MNLKKLCLVSLGLCFLLPGCNRSDNCEDLHQLGDRKESVQRLVDFVDSRLEDGTLSSASSMPGKVKIPGDYRIPYDSMTVGLPNDMEARVILGTGNAITSVFFGDKNMRGVIVNLPNQKNQIVPQKDLLPTESPRAFIVCKPRD